MLNCEENNYGFLNSDINQKDFHKYFEVLKKVSSKSIDELENESFKNRVFKFDTAYNPKLNELFCKYIYKGKIENDDYPVFGHLKIYNSENTDDTELVAPRVFFCMGSDGILFILFFDRYHKIHEKK